MTFFKSIKKGMFVISAVLVVVGYFLVINGQDSVDFVLTILAFGLMASGLIGVVRYFFLKVDERYKRNDFVIGLIFLVLGIVLYFTKEQLRGFSLIAFALIIVISGILKIQDGIDSKRIGVHNFGIYITLLIVSLAVGALIIMKPFSDKAAYLITGAGLVFCGVTDIISNIYLAGIKARYERRLRKAEKTSKVTEKIKEEPKVEEKDDEVEQPLVEGKFTRIDIDSSDKEEPLI